MGGRLGALIKLGIANVLVLGCAHHAEAPPPIVSSTQSSITAEMIGRRFPPMALDSSASEPSYGYSQALPVIVGGGFGEGSRNTYRYLNALLGPAGQTIHYTRVGTCCSFKTPNSPFDGSALLEVYEIGYDGWEARRLYFNWYDAGKPLIPVGLTARK